MVLVLEEERLGGVGKVGRFGHGMGSAGFPETSRPFVCRGRGRRGWRVFVAGVHDGEHDRGRRGARGRRGRDPRCFISLRAFSRGPALSLGCITPTAIQTLSDHPTARASLLSPLSLFFSPSSKMLNSATLYSQARKTPRLLTLQTNKILTNSPHKPVPGCATQFAQRGLDRTDINMWRPGPSLPIDWISPASLLTSNQSSTEKSPRSASPIRIFPSFCRYILAILVVIQYSRVPYIRTMSRLCHSCPLSAYASLQGFDNSNSRTGHVYTWVYLSSPHSFLRRVPHSS
ncbi:hypothetical protein K474DRAFT_403632 [Panus rudis PR-1116 ss-1]|nr:hypothetical protein K474DRAFT_403632 [Panus rudis PR-1116 ss-1]